MDYAVVRLSAPQIRHMTSLKDNETTRKGPEESTFRDELYYIKHNHCYPYTHSGKLLYADVDEENPEHKEHIFGVWAKEELLDKENENAEAAQEALFQHLADNWGFEDFIEGHSSRYDAVKEGFKHDVLHSGNLDITLIDYILSAQSQEDKEVLLSIVSSQSRRKTPRPVLILVEVVEDLRETEAGVTKGWVVAYDFVKSLLIVKPFLSKQDHHLFGEKWDCAVAEDGISFSSSPKVFAAKYIELAEAADDKSVDGGFKMLVHTTAAKWILRQWKGLSNSDAEYFTDELQGKVKNGVTKIKEALQEIPFPINDKAAVDEKIEFKPFRLIFELMEIQEAGIRDAAVHAKDNGNEKVAENAAKLFGKLMDQLKTFNENPEADV